MRVLVVSGIWPPDVGGPASHAPQVADELHARGHRVEVVTTAVREPSPRAYRVSWVSRALPRGVLHAAVVALVARRARAADVVYATSMVERSAAAVALARRPLVVKLAGDVAYERARRRGLYRGPLDAFEDASAGASVRALRLLRTAAVRRAAHVFTPSEFLRRIVLGWGLDPARVSVLPNPAPELPALRDPEALRAELGFAGPTLVFAGRLTAAKALGVALEALAPLEGVSLVVAGDGEERVRLERRASELGLNGRVRFLGAQPRERVLDLLRAADALLLSSSWENLPHAAVEALAVGTPVIATAVGGVPEVVHDDVNGLLVEPDDPAGLRGAVERYLADGALRVRLRASASASVRDPAEVLSTLERVLREVADA